MSENDKFIQLLKALIEPCQIEHRLRGQAKEVFSLLLIMRPFIKAGCREDASPCCQAFFKHRLLGSCFRTGIDHQLFVAGKGITPMHYLQTRAVASFYQDWQQIRGVFLAGSYLGFRKVRCQQISQSLHCGIAYL